MIKLYGHFAIQNNHSKLNPNTEVCFIFNGPHAYVSPLYYSTTIKNVPTWNYSTVHIYGKIKYINDDTKVWELLNETTKIYESENGWKLPKDDNISKILKILRFFEVEETKIEEKFKFNQNRSEEDIKSVIQHLEKNNKIEISKFMKKVNNIV